MTRWGSRAAIALVVIANLALLAAAAQNRRGTADAIVTLTEREAPLAWHDEERTAMAVRLAWQVPRDLRLGLEAARELGVDTTVSPSDAAAGRHYGRTLARDAWAVLEYDGPAYASWLETARVESLRQQSTALDPEVARRAAAEFERLSATSSRLVVVGVGADPAQLRASHPDRSRSIVTRAVVRFRVEGDDLIGRVMEVRPGVVSVPSTHRGVLASVPVAPEHRTAGLLPQASPHYSVTLHYGARREPWVERIERLAR